MKTPSDILEAVRKNNADVYAPDPKTWREWDKRLTDELKKRHLAGQLQTADDYKAIYLEVAKGLEAVK